MDQQQGKLDFGKSAAEGGFSSAEESKDVEASLKYSRDENEFSVDNSPGMGMDNRKDCEIDESDKNIVAEDNSSNKNIIAEDKLISDELKRMDRKIAKKNSRKDYDGNVDKTTNSENTVENVNKTMNSDNTVGNLDKTTNSNNTVKRADKTTNSKSTAKNLDKAKKDKKSNSRNKQQGKAKDLDSSKYNETKGKLTKLKKSKKTEDKNVQKKKNSSNEKKLKEEKTEPAAMQGIPKEKEKKKQKSSTDNKIPKDRTSGQGTKERRRSSFTENTQKDTIRDLPKKIVAKLSKKRERKIKGAIYTESLSEEIKLKMRNESRDTRSSHVLLEDPIMEESEEEDNVEKTRSSSKLTPITRVIITPRLEGGFPHNPPFNMSDPRNGRFSRDSEDDRHSINTDFYTPDLNSRDDVFSDFEDDLDTSNFKPEKKKKKTKKMKRLEKKEKAKKRKAKLLYEKIRGFCDSLYESESLTISIKRERKLKLDTYLPARHENRKYRIKRRKLASLIKVQQQGMFESLTKHDVSI